MSNQTDQRHEPRNICKHCHRPIRKPEGEPWIHTNTGTWTCNDTQGKNSAEPEAECHVVEPPKCPTCKSNDPDERRLGCNGSFGLLHDNCGTEICPDSWHDTVVGQTVVSQALEHLSLLWSEDYRAGMLHAARLCKEEFKRSPEGNHSCIWMGGYEDACDHLSAVIEQAAAISCVPVRSDIERAIEIVKAKRDAHDLNSFAESGNARLIEKAKSDLYDEIIAALKEGK